eukprot:TRINITY_DN14066_c0_g5_i1.p1 TRINITY_DN14066_c0_g5~~TRINITY_DN14066_c0_g5_i1.p1  ORF type:complete len:137 (-),score=9.37 TRINITY_DN14066_c0_g5_i1:291-671(-)
MGPTCDQTSNIQKSGKITDHSLPGQHHTLGCRLGELDVDLPGRHPAVSPVDIMAVMSTGSTETWCQAAGGLCMKSNVSGRHHGQGVDRVHRFLDKNLAGVIPFSEILQCVRSTSWPRRLTGYTRFL